MKKLGFVVLLLGVLLTGCNSNNKNTIISISSKDGIKMVDDKETFVLVVGSSTCSACKEYYPILEQFVDNYPIKIYYLEIDKDSSGQDVKTKFIDEYLNKLQFTPATIIIVDGEIVYKKYGSQSYRDFKDVLVKNGILEE